MIDVIIVDDEKNVLELINSQLSIMAHFQVIGKFTNPIKAYDEIISLKPNLVITDVEMPMLSGVELAQRVSSKYDSIHFVFLTAYKEYAFDAFEINAIHYIMKPVLKKDLEEVYHRLEYVQRIEDTNLNMKNKIFTFGDFSVINSKGKRVQFPTSKVEELFALLIMSRKNGVGKWKLINELWDISEIKNPLQNLYTTIYRLRKTLENYNLPYRIVKSNDNYKIDIEETFFDYEECKKIFHELKETEITAENLTSYKRIVDLYKGDLFMYKDYIWCIYEKFELREYYTILLEKLKKFYIEKNMQRDLSLIKREIKRNFDNI